MTLRIEALSLYGSRWALSEDSGFNSARGLLKQKRGAIDNNYGTGDTVTRLQSRVAVYHLKTARGEIWPKRREKNNRENGYN